MRQYLVTKAGWPGVRQVTRALELTDARSCSPRETTLRLIWRLDAGLPAPRCNWPVADADGRFIGSPDLLCEEVGVVGEYDGAEHRTRRRQRDDVRRDDLFRRVGLEPFRVVGADLEDVPLVVDRMRAGRPGTRLQHSEDVAGQAGPGPGALTALVRRGRRTSR